MKKLLYLIVIFAIIAFVTVTLSKNVMAAGSPLQISPFHGDANSPCGVFYAPAPYSFS